MGNLWQQAKRAGLNLNRWENELRQNLTVRNFGGGHMFYAWEKSRGEFHATSRDFYRSALGEPGA